jgi:hypothetical protein
VSPLDKTAGGAGTRTSASSVAATTTSANELIFGADMTTTHFTEEEAIITNPDAERPDGQQHGSYSATAPATSSNWVMQMVTFRAAQ